MRWLLHKALFAYPNSDGPAVRIGGGVMVPALILAWALVALNFGLDAIPLGNTRGLHDLEQVVDYQPYGINTVGEVLVLLGIALFAHGHCFWGTSERLAGKMPLAKIGGIGLFVVGCVAPLIF